MKKTKIISVILAVVLCFSAFSVIGFAETDAEKAHLKFGDDGKFTILNFSDIHASSVLDATVKRFLIESVKEVKPDLVILTGDNVTKFDTRTAAGGKMGIKGVMSVFQKAGVPVTYCYGNHDDQDSKMNKEKQFECYKTFNVCIADDEVPELSGCATHNVPIYASDDSKVAFNIWMIDSNTYAHDENGNEDGYSCVQADELQWYVGKSNKLAAENGGLVPSLCFQHIVPREIYDNLKVVPDGTEGAIYSDGKCYVLPDGALGVLGESPCPCYEKYNQHQFDVMKNQGDVLAIVSGHDHVNTFDIDCGGMRLINSPISGFGSYGNEETRGARVFVIDENDPTNFETHLIKLSDVVANDTLGNIFYTIRTIFDQIGDFFKDLGNQIKSIFTKK